MLVERDDPYALIAQPSNARAAIDPWSSQQMAASHAADAFLLKLLIGLAFVAVAVGIALFRRRRSIATRADDMVVNTLAAGVRGKRRLQQKATSFAQRVNDRANQPPQP